MNINQYSFSILITNYNYSKFVAKAIDSCLSQDYPEELFEIIVVDDGSTDNSKEVLEQYKNNNQVKIIYQNNQGQASTFNTAFENSSKDFICLLDSDDYFFPNKLQVLAEKLQAWQVSSSTKFFLSHDSNILNYNTQKLMENTWLKMIQVDTQYESLHISSIQHISPFANPCGQVISRVLFEQIITSLPLSDWKRGVDSAIGHAALMIIERVHYIYESLSVYRVHGNNFSLNFDKKTELMTPTFNWLTLRWPKLIYYLDNLLSTLDLTENERNTRLGFLRRKERDLKISSQKYTLPQPKVSIAILNYNYAKYLTKSIESALSQTHSNLEIILCDDGSNDNSTEIMVDYQNKYPNLIKTIFHKENKGALATMKSAYSLIGTTDYFVLLDADDILDNYFIERHLYTHRFSSLCMVTSSDIRFINTQGELLHSNCYNSSGSWSKKLEYFPPFSARMNDWIFAPSSANMFRKTKMTDLFFEALDEYFCTKLRMMQDWLLLFYAHIIGGSTRLNECLSSMRLHDKNNSTQLHFPTPLVKALANNKPDFQVAALFFIKFFCFNLVSIQKHYSLDGLKAYLVWIKAVKGLNINLLIGEIDKWDIPDNLKQVVIKSLRKTHEETEEYHISHYATVEKSN